MLDILNIINVSLMVLGILGRDICPFNCSGEKLPLRFIIFSVFRVLIGSFW